MSTLTKTRIELGTASFNPVPGCTNGCPWCWARRMAKRNLVKCKKCRSFEPHLHKERLGQPIHTRKPQRVLVCWTGDLFCKGVKKEWIQKVFEACKAAPWHKYFFLTKCPQNIPKNTFEDNWWFGTSITGTPGPENRNGDKYRQWILKETGIKNIFLMIEPCFPSPHIYDIQCFKWLVIGAQTGRNPIAPDKEDIEFYIKRTREAGIPLFLKDNLLKRLPELSRVQEIPKELIV